MIISMEKPIPFDSGEIADLFTRLLDIGIENLQLADDQLGFSAEPSNFNYTVSAYGKFNVKIIKTPLIPRTTLTWDEILEVIYEYM